MTCQLCDGKRYTSKVQHTDGSWTYGVCPCTGITADSLKELADAIGDESMTVELPEEQDG